MLDRRFVALGILAGAAFGMAVEYGRILWFEHCLRTNARSGTLWLN